MRDWRAAVHERLNRREQNLLALFARVRREVDAGKHEESEPGRVWLEQFCQGVGVQLCAGQFQLGDSIGINSDPNAIATDHWCYADRFTGDLPPLDYIVTNYLECFPDPLRVLQSWAGRMRTGGVMAVIARNSELYDNERGPLKNVRRASCFSLKTLAFTLERAGYAVFCKETYEMEIRIAARKR